jgi:hypothetical protein
MAMDAGGTFQRLKSSLATMCSFLSLSNIMVFPPGIMILSPCDPRLKALCRATTAEPRILNIAITVPSGKIREFLRHNPQKRDIAAHTHRQNVQHSLRGKVATRQNVHSQMQ